MTAGHLNQLNPHQPESTFFGTCCWRVQYWFCINQHNFGFIRFWPDAFRSQEDRTNILPIKHTTFVLQRLNEQRMKGKTFQIKISFICRLRPFLWRHTARRREKVPCSSVYPRRQLGLLPLAFPKLRWSDELCPCGSTCTRLCSSHRILLHEFIHAWTVKCHRSVPSRIKFEFFPHYIGLRKR